MSNQLFTIGYEGWDLPAFLDHLAAHGVERVIDVRENPFSRKPGFSKKSLWEALEARGIQYVHMKELGTPRPLRDVVKEDGNYDKFFHDMREYLATRQEAIEQACDYVGRETCCLICYEALVDTCHRRLVAQMIREQIGGELSVVHLRAE